MCKLLYTRIMYLGYITPWMRDYIKKCRLMLWMISTKLHTTYSVVTLVTAKSLEISRSTGYYSHSATSLEYFSRSRKSHHFEGVKTCMEWISYTIRCWIRCWKFQVSTLGLTLLTLVLNSGVEQVSRPRLFNDWLSSSSSCWGCLKKWNSVSNFGLELVLNSGVELVLIWSSWAVP